MLPLSTPLPALTTPPPAPPESPVNYGLTGDHVARTHPHTIPPPPHHHSAARPPLQSRRPSTLKQASHGARISTLAISTANIPPPPHHHAAARPSRVAGQLWFDRRPRGAHGAADGADVTPHKGEPLLSPAARGALIICGAWLSQMPSTPLHAALVPSASPSARPASTLPTCNTPTPPGKARGLQRRWARVTRVTPGAPVTGARPLRAPRPCWRRRPPAFFLALRPRVFGC